MVFFYDAGEVRLKSGNGYRVVRVGTQALRKRGTENYLGWLKNHRGSVRTGFGNHRGSIFRLLVGVSLARQRKIELPDYWVLGKLESTSGRNESS